MLIRAPQGVYNGGPRGAERRHEELQLGSADQLVACHAVIVPGQKFGSSFTVPSSCLSQCRNTAGANP